MALVQTHEFRNVLWSKSYCLVVVFILKRDSKKSKSDRNKSQNEDINSCVYADIQRLRITIYPNFDPTEVQTHDLHNEQ